MITIETQTINATNDLLGHSITLKFYDGNEASIWSNCERVEFSPDVKAFIAALFNATITKSRGTTIDVPPGKSLYLRTEQVELAITPCPGPMKTSWSGRGSAPTILNTAEQEWNRYMKLQGFW